MIHALSWITFSTTLVLLMIVTWKRLRSISVLLGLLLIYYFSLYGCAFIIAENFGLETGMRFKNLAAKLVYPNLDDDYWLTMLGYFLFIVSIIAGLWMTTSPTNKATHDIKGLDLNFGTLATISLIFQALALFLIKDHLLEIAVGNAAGYEIFSSIESNGYYSLSKAVREIGMTAAFAGLGAYWTNRGTDFQRSSIALPLSLLNIVLATSVSIITGDKHELLTSILAGIAAYSLLGGQFRPLQIGGLVLLSLAVFSFIEGTRGANLFLADEHSLGGSFLTGVFDTVTSNEAFAAHLSLYGVFKYDLPVHWGSGFMDFILSIPPRFLGLPRPEGIYQMYVEGVFAKIGQGFTIHHATAWYLNLSWLGFILGGLLFGCFWGSTIEIAKGSRTEEKIWRKALAFAMPVAILGYLPSLIRSAIETYKGFTVFAIGLFLIFYLSARKGKSHEV